MERPTLPVACANPTCSAIIRVDPEMVPQEMSLAGWEPAGPNQWMMCPRCVQEAK